MKKIIILLIASFFLLACALTVPDPEGAATDAVGVVPSATFIAATTLAPTNTVVTLAPTPTTSIPATIPPTAAATIPPGATRLTFAAGTTYLGTMQQAIGTNQTISFVLNASQGQFMDVSAGSFTASDQIPITIYGVQDGKRLTQADSGNEFWSGTLPLTQDYVIQVVNRGNPTTFTLQVSVPARITFAPGAVSATVTGRIPSLEITNQYLIRANAGQKMRIKVTSPGDAVRVSVCCGGDANAYFPLMRSEIGTGPVDFEVELPATRDYTITTISYTLVPVDYTVEVIINP